MALVKLEFWRMSWKIGDVSMNIAWYNQAWNSKANLAWSHHRTSSMKGTVGIFEPFKATKHEIETRASLCGSSIFPVFQTRIMRLPRPACSISTGWPGPGTDGGTVGSAILVKVYRIGQIDNGSPAGSDISNNEEPQSRGTGMGDGQPKFV
ncbi:hypothetical protein CONLIGDRAFT_633160 [Coniochaeta ligniaria NRRL 30616]|uniref:Uncharacterized protein n=1 Tax=Coniochaeta ligniaria NRRL 30616 TaxID=1408157 RepID=A0A1J7JGU7_9PEZI|nr:hypothetical protein CONLIGDRAFT_633160 [Coniochaeta ligniaria NRRL 30616]